MVRFDLLLHLLLDLRKIFGRDAVAEFHVVIKAVLDRRAGRELGVGPEAQYGGGEDVGAGVSNPLQLGHLQPVIGRFVFVGLIRSIHNSKEFNHRWTQMDTDDFSEDDALPFKLRMLEV